MRKDGASGLGVPDQDGARVRQVLGAAKYIGPRRLSNDRRAGGTRPCAATGSGLTYNHMVVRRALTDADLDRLFRALADRTRRDIVTRLLRGEETSVSALAARYDMSFAAVQKHVAVLEEAGLVTKHQQGRERIVHGNPERISRARDLLTQLEGLWRARFARLDRLFDETTNPG